MTTQKIVFSVSKQEKDQLYYLPQFDRQVEIEYHLEPYAQCTIIDHDVTISDQASTDNRHMTITFYCAHNAQLTYFTSMINGACNTQIIKVVLQGRHAQARIRGVYLLNESQQVVVQSVQDHQAADTRSDLCFKGVLDGSAQAVYEGMIHIGELADRSRAIQQNKNLLLGDHAQARSIPSLEVLTNDVSCTHGSAVGQLDPAHLFYVQSRGLEENVSKKLLIKGFVADTLKDIAGVDQDLLIESITKKV